MTGSPGERIKLDRESPKARLIRVCAR
jgi:hypothetical protein